MNPMIALGARAPQFDAPDPNAESNRMLRMLQMGEALDTAQMNRLKADEYRTGVARKNKMLSLLDQDYAKPEDRESALLRGGFVDEASKLSKDRREAAKQQADAEKAQLETAHKRVELMGQSLGWLRQNPSLDNARSVVNYLTSNGVMPREKAQAALAQFEADPTPEGVARFATLGYQTALSAKDQLPTYQTRNTGGTTDTLAIDPVSGQVRVANSVQNTQDPNSVAQVAATIRGQNMTDARSRESARLQQEANAIQREAQQTQVFNDPNMGLVLVNKGTKTAVPAVGPDGRPLASEAAVKKQRAAQATLPIIAEAERLIEGATGSYLGAGVDMAAQAVGKSTQGAQATAKLKALEGQLMMAQPRMEGPQSNLDLTLYRQMAGQIGDPTIPRETKKAALETIKSLQMKYANGGGGATGSWGPPAAPAAPGAPGGRVVDFGSLR